MKEHLADAANTELESTLLHPALIEDDDLSRGLINEDSIDEDAADFVIECDGANDKLCVRRKLEDRLDEKRLKKLTQDFDFDGL